jgi:hypothetical protein
MEPLNTANNMFKYDHKFIDTPLDVWVQEAHKYNCEKNNWKHFPLKRGSFGYDNLAVSLGCVLEYYISNDCILPTSEYIASLVHEGWCKNYIYWRDNNPQNSSVYKYIAPYNSLGDERRNLCSQTPFEMLDKDEQDKDYIIANFIYEKLNKMIINI